MSHDTPRMMRLKTLFRPFLDPPDRGINLMDVPRSDTKLIGEGRPVKHTVDQRSVTWILGVRIPISRIHFCRRSFKRYVPEFCRTITTRGTGVGWFGIGTNTSLKMTSDTSVIGNAIDSGIGLSITIDNLRVFINKTLSILSAYQ